MKSETYRWVGLTRVSTKGQADEGGSLDDQRERIEKFVAQRGDTLVEVFADAGVPGTLERFGQRVALAEALQMLNRGEADGVVVPRLDRLGRELALQEIVMHEIRKLGCTLASCDPGEQDIIDNDGDDLRRMSRQILAVFADYERRMIRARTLAGRLRAIREGGWAGGYAPYGYEPDGTGKLREVAHEMDALAQARTMREMKATYATIGEYWNAAGMRLRKGNVWHGEVVKRVLAKCEENDYPKSQPLNNLAKIVLGLPTDSKQV